MTSLPGRWRWCDRPWLCDARESKRASHLDPPASSYAIMRRACPYRGENPGPGKDVRGELDRWPGIREQPGSNQYRLVALSNDCDVRFSNRPVGVKRFQTIHHNGANVARGFVLLSGLGTKAFPSWDSKTRWNNLNRGLAVGRSKRTCELTSSIVPRGTSFHRWVELEFPP